MRGKGATLASALRGERVLDGTPSQRCSPPGRTLHWAIFAGSLREQSSERHLNFDSEFHLTRSFNSGAKTARIYV